MSCVGIDYCDKKNCLEQEKCIHDIKKNIEAGINRPKNWQLICKINKEWCCNKRACEILGECIREHPLVIADQQASSSLRKSASIVKIVKIITRLKPTLKRYKRYKYRNR